MRIFFSAILATLFAVSVAGAQPAPQPNPADPKFQSKGEQDRTYTFPGTSEQISYHVYVPMKWDKNIRLPLVIVTHGANQPPTAPFQRPMANPTLAKMAEDRGFIVAAVTGYHANATGVGGWNVPYAMVQVPRPAARRRWPPAADRVVALVAEPPRRRRPQRTFSGRRWTCSTSPG